MASVTTAAAVLASFLNCTRCALTTLETSDLIAEDELIEILNPPPPAVTDGVEGFNNGSIWFMSSLV
ncbi:hypothetical protein HC766_00760 [Candidatus Gracilibacteria bacterium]|nr:hypothetical protein [Candidatus Gracilibacteria bacterium]